MFEIAILVTGSCLKVNVSEPWTATRKERCETRQCSSQRQKKLHRNFGRKLTHNERGKRSFVDVDLKPLISLQLKNINRCLCIQSSCHKKHHFLPRKLSVFVQEDSLEFEWLREELVSPLTTRTAELQFLGWPVIGRELAWTQHRLEIGSFLPQYEDY